MAAKTLFVLVVLTVAYVTAVTDCNKLIAVTGFNMNNLCGKTYNVLWKTNPQESCVTNNVVCNSEGVVINSKIFVNGILSKSIKAVVKDLGDGRATLTYPDVAGSTPVTQVITSFSEFADNTFKFSAVNCLNNVVQPYAKVIAGNNDYFDVTDELKNLNKLYPTGDSGNLAALPNTCVAKDNF